MAAQRMDSRVFASQTALLHIGLHRSQALDGWHFGACSGLSARSQRPNAQIGCLFFGSVEPVGQHEQAKDNKHDDQDVVNLHGASLSKKG